MSRDTYYASFWDLATKKYELAVNKDLARIKEQMVVNKLSLNVAKTKLLLIVSYYKINNSSLQPIIKIDRTKIKQVYKSRVFGVDIDNKLKWNNHIGIASSTKTL